MMETKAEASKSGAESKLKLSLWPTTENLRAYEARSTGKKAADYIKNGGTIPLPRRVKKETKSVRMLHRLSIFPIGMADMNHPTVKSSLAKCKMFGVRFYRVEEETVSDTDFVGCLQIHFKRMSATLKAVQELKAIRDGLSVFQMGDTSIDKTKADAKWGETIETVSGVNATGNSVDCIMFIPNPPPNLDMEQLGDLFSDVEDAIIIAKDNESAKRYAWVAFKSMAGLQKAMAAVEAEKGIGGYTFDAYLYKELMALYRPGCDAHSGKPTAKDVASETGAPGTQPQKVPIQTAAPLGQGKTKSSNQVVKTEPPRVTPGVGGTTPPAQGATGQASQPRGVPPCVTPVLQADNLTRQTGKGKARQRSRKKQAGNVARLAAPPNQPQQGAKAADRQPQQLANAADRQPQQGAKAADRQPQQLAKAADRQPQQGAKAADRQPQQGARTADRQPQQGARAADRQPQQGAKVVDRQAQQRAKAADRQPQQGARAADRQAQQGAKAADRQPQQGARAADRQPQERPRAADRQPQQRPRAADRQPQQGARAADRQPQQGARAADRHCSRDRPIGHRQQNVADRWHESADRGRQSRWDDGSRQDGPRRGDPTPAVKEDPIYARSLAMMGESDRGLLGSPPKRRMDNRMAVDRSPKRLRGNDDLGGYPAGRQDTSYQPGGRGVDNNDLQGGVGGGDLYGGRRDNYDLGGRDGDGGRVGDPTPTPAVKEDPIYARSLAMLGGSDHGAQGQDPQQRRGAGKRKPSLSEGEAHPSEHIGGKRKPDMEDNRNYPALLSPVRARVTSPMAIAHSPRRIHDDDDFRCQAGRQSYPLAGRTEGHRFHGDVVGGDASMSDSRRQPYDLGGQDAAHDMYSSRATDTGITGLRSSKHDLYSPVARDRDLGGLGSVKHDLAGAVGRDRDLGGLGSLKHDLAGAIGRDRDLGGPGSLKHDLAGAVGRATDGGLYGRATQDFDLRGLETNRRETEPLGRDQPAGRDRDWGWRGVGDFEDQLQGYGNRSQPQDRLGLPVDDSRVLGYGIGRDRRHDNYDTRSGTGYSSGLMDGMVCGGGGGGQMAMYRTRDPALTPTDGPAVSGGLQSTDASGYWSTSAVALDDRVAAGRCAVETSFWDRGKEVESERGGAETGWHGEGVVDQRHKRNTRDEIGWKGEATIDQRHKRNAGGDSVPWQSY